MKIVAPLEKTDARAIQLEVVLKDDKTKKIERPKTATLTRQSPKKKKIQETPNTKFSERVELCCLTMTAGPGTSFGDYSIPEGAHCSLCGSTLKKGRK